MCVEKPRFSKQSDTATKNFCLEALSIIIEFLSLSAFSLFVAGGLQYIIMPALTLSISMKLKETLEAAGYNVVMTRTGETAGDLYERSELANAVGADLFVSIHINAAENVPSFQGLYTYHHPSSGRGKKFAQMVQSAVCEVSGAIDRGIASADFVVLRETNMAAVLVECGFMSNVEELERLKSDDYQWKLAQGITRGVTDYLNTGAIQK